MLRRNRKIATADKNHNRVLSGFDFFVDRFNPLDRELETVLSFSFLTI